MASVDYDDNDNLVILSFDSRKDTLLLDADAAGELWKALEEKASYAEGHMAGQRAAGKLIVPREEVSQIWNARLGLFRDGVAIQFDQMTDRVPLPPAVAKELAKRVRRAVEAYHSDLIIRGKSPNNREFGKRPVIV